MSLHETQVQARLEALAAARQRHDRERVTRPGVSDTVRALVESASERRNDHAKSRPSPRPGKPAKGP